MQRQALLRRQVLALSTLSGLLASCCLVLLWCLIAAPPAVKDRNRPKSNLKQQRQQQQRQLPERQQISVYDEAYLPTLDRLPAAMSQCMATRSQLPSTADLAAACVAALYSTLPRLAVVMSCTADHVDNEQLARAHNVESWAIRHGYAFHYNVINPEDYAREADFYTKRWLAVQQRFWGRSQWVLAIDSDVMAVNLTRSLDAWLELPQDLVLTVREEKEVTAAAVLLRSTLFGWCFLDYWAASHGRIAGNGDNGVLLQVVMDMLDTLVPGGKAAECFEARHDYRDAFLPCFHRHFHPALLGVEKHLPTRALFPYGGFLREHQGAAAGDSVTDRTLGRCWSTDLLVHGSHNFRDMGASLWPLEVRQNWTAQATVPGRFCDWLTPEQELDTAAECCYWHHPGCMTVGGRNSCREAEHCAGSEWGVSGAGLRRCAACCTEVFG